VRLLAGKKTLGRGPKRHTLFFQPSIERTVVPLPGSTRRPASSSRSSRRTGPRAKHAESDDLRCETRCGVSMRSRRAVSRISHLVRQQFLFAFVADPARPVGPPRRIDKAAAAHRAQYARSSSEQVFMR
jgi:hypothetical protein